jgi:hypothetical protein
MAGTGEAWIGPAGSKIFGFGRPTDEEIRTYNLHRVTGLLAFPYAVRWMPPGPSFGKVLVTKVLPALAIGAAVLAIPGVAAGAVKYGAAGAKKLIPYAKGQAKDIASSAISNTFSALPIGGATDAVETTPQATDTLSNVNQTSNVTSGNPNANTFILFGGGAIVLILIIVMMMRK